MEFLFVVLIPMAFIGIGFLLIKKPHFMTERELLGIRPLFHAKWMVKFLGFWFTIGGSIFLIVGLIGIMREIVSK